MVCRTVQYMWRKSIGSGTHTLKENIKLRVTQTECEVFLIHIIRTIVLINLLCLQPKKLHNLFKLHRMERNFYT